MGRCAWLLDTSEKQVAGAGRSQRRHRRRCIDPTSGRTNLKRRTSAIRLAALATMSDERGSIGKSCIATLRTDQA